MLDRLEEAEADVARSLTAVGGTVRIAVFQSAAHAMVPQALTLLRAEHPDLRVEVTEREPDVGLFEVAARDFDLVIAEQYPGHTRAHRDDLDRVHLASDAIRLALPPHPRSRRGRVAGWRRGSRRHRQRMRAATLAAAAAMPWVLEPQGTASREWAEQLCREAGFEPDVRFETADLMAHIRLIRSGNAVGLLPDLVWAGEAPSVTLVDLPGHPEREVFSSTRLAAADRPGGRRLPRRAGPRRAGDARPRRTLTPGQYDAAMARMLRSTTLAGTILLAAALALVGVRHRRRRGDGGSPSASASADEISAGAAAGTWGDADDTTQPSLELAEDGTLTGTDGCNQLSGEWTRERRRPHVRERRLDHDGLRRRRHVARRRSTPPTIDGSTMTVHDESGKDIGTLERRRTRNAAAAAVGSGVTESRGAERVDVGVVADHGVPSRPGSCIQGV